MRNIIKIGVTEIKNKEPEYKFELSGSLEEQTTAIANIHFMKVNQIAKVSGLSFEKALDNYVEALKAITLSLKTLTEDKERNGKSAG